LSEHEPDWAAQDFHLGAEVRASDGTVVGELKRVLVEDPDYGLKGLVVREGGRFSGLLLSPGSMLLADEVIVPADAVREVAHDRIELKLSSADVRRLPAYLEFRQEPETAGEELVAQAEVLSLSPSIPPSVREVANKAADQLEIEGGENVMVGRTGKRLGGVKDVLFDDGELVGIVLRPEGWFKQDVILPRRFLGRSDDAALFAELTEDDLARLEPFTPL
jgi:sporulation protein YlmC with PRC-barrel domain